MFSMLIANIIGITILFFFLWKRLKEDYQYEKIFNLGIFILIGFLVGFFIARGFIPSYWFWTEIIGIGIGFTVGIKKQKIIFFESFEGLVVGLLFWQGLYYLVDSILRSSLFSFIAFWINLLCIFLFFFLDSRYKRFAWYKSGRVGLAGILTTAIYFVFKAGLSYKNIFELAILSTVAFIFFLVLYKLSRSKE